MKKRVRFTENSKKSTQHKHKQIVSMQKTGEDKQLMLKK